MTGTGGLGGIILWRHMVPPVSVIIPARRAADTVAAAIRSALDQEGVVEVVVAYADEETRAAAAAVGDPRLRLIANPSGSTPWGLNLALAASRGAVVVRCDAHSVLPPGYVARAVDTLGATGAANVGGRQVPVGDSFWARAIALAMTSPLGAGDARYRIGGNPGPTDTVYLGVFDRSALAEVGGFDESLERNQDYELNWRLRQAGKLVWFDPELAVTYRPRSSLPQLAHQYFDYGRWKREVLRRHPRSLRWRQLAPPTLVVALVASALAAPALGWLALVAPAAYLAATVTAGIVDLGRRRDPAGLAEPGALWVMHLAWGVGFLSGPPPGKRRGRRRAARRSDA